jgi:chromosome segregation ATPase
VIRKHLSGKYVDKDEKIEQLRADLVRLTEGRDGLRSTLDEANKIIAWQRTELDQLKKNAGHSALRREAFDKLAQAGKLAGAPSGDVYACDSEEPAKGSDV